MGWTPDQRRKSTENSYFYSIENYRAWASIMLIRILHIRLFSIILPYFWTCRSRELTTWIRTTSQVARLRSFLCLPRDVGRYIARSSSPKILGNFLLRPCKATWEVVRIQVVSSRLLQVQKIRENDRK